MRRYLATSGLGEVRAAQCEMLALHYTSLAATLNYVTTRRRIGLIGV
jgi:hypothetical protein